MEFDGDNNHNKNEEDDTVPKARRHTGESNHDDQQEWKKPRPLVTNVRQSLSRNKPQTFAHQQAAYTNVERFYQVDDYLFMRAIGQEDNQPVLIRKKVKDQAGDGAPFYSIHPNDPDIDVYPYMIGIPLSIYFEHHPLSIREALSISLQVIDVYTAKQVVPITEQLLITDTNQLSVLPLPKEVVRKQEKYHAPEQFLTNAEDYAVQQSELYSLGMVLYHLFSGGESPFPHASGSRWEHNHLAVAPVQLPKVNPDVPGMIDKIILTMLEKDPKHRYPKVELVKRDLRACMDQLKTDDRITPFALSFTTDLAKLQTPSYYYGKEKEMEQLHEQFKQVLLGSTSVVLVDGPAGIGKTTFIDQQFRQMVQNQATYISGKFDQTNHLPYQPLIDAFRQVVMQILTENDKQVASWKKKIVRAIGRNARIITEVIPELAAIIGETPEPEPLLVEDAPNRFVHVFRQFVQVFTTSNQPLVLFLDDVQWADKASLQLVHSLITDPNSHHLLVIASFRTNQAGHVIRQFEGLERFGVTYTHHTLAPFSLKDVERFVAYTLATSPDMVKGLAVLVFRKTAGNPFYMKHMLRMVQANGWISFDAQKNAWTWDHQAIEAVQDQEQIIQFMEERIHLLPDEVVEILKVASCLGSRFYADDLIRFIDQPAAKIYDALHVAEQNGLVFPPDPSVGHKCYQFFHDRIQELVYSFDSESEKKQIHLSFARFLTTIDETEAVLYKLVDHYNKGIELIDDPKEQDLLLHLNVRTAHKAQASSAYDAACNYYETAIRLLRPEHCEENFSFCFNIYKDLAVVAYHNGEYKKARNINDQLLTKARTWQDRSIVYLNRVVSYAHQGEFQASLETGITCLEEAGFQIPAELNQRDMEQMAYAVLDKMGRDWDELRHLPEVTDERIEVVLRVCFHLLVPSFFTNKPLYTWLICTAMELTLKHGSTQKTPALLTGFGVLLSTTVTELDKAYQIGKIAVELADAGNSDWIRCKTYVMFGGIICPWVKQFEQGERYLEEAVELGQRSGDYVYTGMAISCHMNLSYITKSLDQIKEINATYSALAEQMRSELILQNITLYIQYARCLQGFTEGNKTFNDFSFDEKKFLQQVELEDSKVITNFQYATYKLQINYLYRNYQEALTFAEQAEDIYPYVKHSPHLWEYQFYKMLARLAVWDEYDDSQRDACTKAYHQLLKDFEAQGAYNQDLFGYKIALLEAEYANATRDVEQAMTKYEQAIEEAKYDRDIALCVELTGQFYQKLGHKRIARVYMEDAIDAYARWGARAKVEELERAYFPSARRRVANKQEGEQHTPAVNLGNLVQTTTKLAEDRDYRTSLQRLIDAIKQETAAEKVALIHKTSASHLHVVAIVKDSANYLFGRVPIDKSKEVPISLVRYVARTKQTVDALDNTFARYSYLQRVRPKSMVCLPLLLQGECHGILYLENRYVSGLFTDEKIDTAKYLGTQAVFVLRLIDTFGWNAGEHDNAHEQEDKEYEELTEREVEILNLMAAGLSNQEIARTLGVKVGTIKVHNHNIFLKLDVNRRTKAIAKAKQLNILD